MSGRIAVLAVLAVLACSRGEPDAKRAAFADTLTVSASTAGVSATLYPNLPSLDAADARLQQACSRSVTQGIGAIQLDGGLTTPFSTRHGMLLLKKATKPEILDSALQSQKLKLTRDTTVEAQQCVIHQVKGDPPVLRDTPPDRAKRISVLLPNDLTSAGASLLPKNARFCDDGRSKRTLEAVQKFNSDLNDLPPGNVLFGARLTVDHFTVPYQLLDTTQTGVKDAPMLDARATNYWRVMDLFRAWQLSQVAVLPTRRTVRAAIVDLDFNNQDSNITWDQHDDNDTSDASFGVPGARDRSWHGSNCGSVLNATVTDQTGASGSALFGSNSTVPSLNNPRQTVQTIAAQVADVSARATIDSIECAVWQGGADVISVSRGLPCATKAQCAEEDDALANVLQYAAKNSVSVFFAAGQSSLYLDPSTSQPSYYQWGCQTRGVLCVGGMDMSGNLARIAGHYSNFGPSVELWGPAEGVPVNADPSMGITQAMWGTSLSAPFIAGIVALSESVWGKTFNNDQLRPALLAASKPGDITVKSVLKAYPFLRTSPDGVPVRIAADARERNDDLPLAGKPSDLRLTEPVPTELLTLDSGTDVDFLPIVQSAPGTRKIQVRYIAGDDADPLAVRLVRNSALDEVPISLNLGSNGNPLPNSGLKTIVYNLPAGQYYLEVSAANNLTTAYAVDTNYVSPSGTTE